MNIEKLFEKRQSGIVRLGFSRPFESDPIEGFKRIESASRMLSRFGLSCEDESLISEIDRSAAFDILNTLLLKDMVYRIQEMAPNEANSIAEDFVSLFPEDGSRYYSNGRWDKNSHPWQPMTESTFDGGVMIISEEIAGCIWFQEED